MLCRYLKAISPNWLVSGGPKRKRAGFRKLEPRRAKAQICGASLGSGGFLRRGAGRAERGALRRFSFDLSPIRPDGVTSRSLCSATL